MLGLYWKQQLQKLTCFLKYNGCVTFKHLFELMAYFSLSGIKTNFSINSSFICKRQYCIIWFKCEFAFVSSGTDLINLVRFNTMFIPHYLKILNFCKLFNYNQEQLPYPSQMFLLLRPWWTRSSSLRSLA